MDTIYSYFINWCNVHYQALSWYAKRGRQHSFPLLHILESHSEERKHQRQHWGGHELINNMEWMCVQHAAVVNYYSFGIRHLSQLCRQHNTPPKKLYWHREAENKFLPRKGKCSLQRLSFGSQRQADMLLKYSEKLIILWIPLLCVYFLQTSGHFAFICLLFCWEMQTGEAIALIYL